MVEEKNNNERKDSKLNELLLKLSHERITFVKKIGR